MKTYLILRDTVANQQKVKAGDIVELPIDEGSLLVGYGKAEEHKGKKAKNCLLYTSPSPRDYTRSRMPSSA